MKKPVHDDVCRASCLEKEKRPKTDVLGRFRVQIRVLNLQILDFQGLLRRDRKQDLNFTHYQYTPNQYHNEVLSITEYHETSRRHTKSVYKIVYVNSWFSNRVQLTKYRIWTSIFLSTRLLSLHTASSLQS